ncbi:MAG TPA: cytochrome c maturation protein CcmE [Gemmatimonadaceae bacterium]
MKARTKFLIGGALILGASGYVATNATTATSMYYFTPSELAAKVEADPSFHGTGVKMGARVVPGTIRREDGGRTHRFEVTDGARTWPVVYRGIAPDTFTDSVDVVVEGRLDASGTFQATTLLAKCASRYEAAPGEPGAPGYGTSAPAGAPGYGAPAPQGAPPASDSTAGPTA